MGSSCLRRGGGVLMYTARIHTFSSIISSDCRRENRPGQRDTQQLGTHGRATPAGTLQLGTDGRTDNPHWRGTLKPGTQGRTTPAGYFLSGPVLFRHRFNRNLDNSVKVTKSETVLRHYDLVNPTLGASHNTSLIHFSREVFQDTPGHGTYRVIRM